MTGKAYRAIRHKLGLSQRELAEAVGVDKNTIARRERDERAIGPEAEAAIRDLLRRKESGQ
jgi:transcriptional regulator with XRE-family HTH domain